MPTTGGGGGGRAQASVPSGQTMQLTGGRGHVCAAAGAARGNSSKVNNTIAAMDEFPAGPFRDRIAPQCNQRLKSGSSRTSASGLRVWHVLMGVILGIAES